MSAGESYPSSGVPHERSSGKHIDHSVPVEGIIGHIVEIQRNRVDELAKFLSLQFDRLGVVDGQQAYFSRPHDMSGKSLLMLQRLHIRTDGQYERTMMRVIYNTRENDIVQRGGQMISSKFYLGYFDGGSCMSGHFAQYFEDGFTTAEIPLDMPPLIYADSSENWRLYQNPRYREPLPSVNTDNASFDQLYDYTLTTATFTELLRGFSELDREDA